MTLEQIATAFDCSIHHDKDGDAALLRLLEYPDNDAALHPGSLDWEDARAAVKKALGT